MVLNRLNKWKCERVVIQKYVLDILGFKFAQPLDTYLSFYLK